MKMLVTGATGKLGSQIVEYLLEMVPSSKLAVSVRNPEKAEKLKNLGVDVRQGDFDYPEILVNTFSGIDRLLIISTDGDNETRIRQHTNAVAAAKEAGVKFIAYTSVANAQQSSLFLAPVHRATEDAILQTGIPYSFLRNNWYLENEIGSIQAALSGAPWLSSAGTGKVGWAPQKDYAQAAAMVLAGSGHENTIYELSGNLMTQEALAATLGKVLGKEIPVQQVDDATYADIMKGTGIPDFVVPILADIQKAIRDGALEIASNDFEKLLGRKLTPISEGLEEIIRTLQ